MKKILVAGASIAAGTGFPLGIDDPGTWPNQLKKKLNCQLDNISIPGSDITGLLLNATQFMYKHEYDLILLEVPYINRLIISPNIHGAMDISGRHTFEDYSAWHDWFKKLHITNKDINHFLKIITLLNSDYEHWKRLVGVITTVQILNSKGFKIRFVNNGVRWDYDFFKNRNSNLVKQIINADLLPNCDIEFGLTKLEEDKKLIDLALWINPFNSLVQNSVDLAPMDNTHPGINSNNVYSDWIVNYLMDHKLWND